MGCPDLPPEETKEVRRYVSKPDRAQLESVADEVPLTCSVVKSLPMSNFTTARLAVVPASATPV